ncbi:MAG: hypothetical protein C4523_17775 [Myxococcales bacterium]|nr:MAG: hypothetical protein C4523_17775 [Myxococcales bacterium]
MNVKWWVLVAAAGLVFLSCESAEVSSDGDGDSGPCEDGAFSCRGESEVLRCESGEWVFYRDCSTDGLRCLEGVCSGEDGDGGDGDVSDGDLDGDSGDGDSPTDGDNPPDGDISDGDAPDGDSDAPCNGACDADAGQYCDGAACQTIACTLCLTDDNCPLTFSCQDDRAAQDGYKVCLTSQDPCPAGYAKTHDGWCRPTAMCPVVEFADYAQPCRTEEHPERPPCRLDLECQRNDGGIMCTHRCELNTDCASFSNEEGWCYCCDTNYGFCGNVMSGGCCENVKDSDLNSR